MCSSQSGQLEIELRAPHRCIVSELTWIRLQPRDIWIYDRKRTLLTGIVQLWSLMVRLLLIVLAICHQIDTAAPYHAAWNIYVNEIWDWVREIKECRPFDEKSNMHTLYTHDEKCGRKFSLTGTQVQWLSTVQHTRYRKSTLILFTFVPTGLWND